MVVIPQVRDLLSSTVSSEGQEAGLAGQSLGCCSRNAGPWLHRLGCAELLTSGEVVRRVAGRIYVPPGLKIRRPVTSWISATLVPTKTLNRHDSDWSQLSTVVESVQCTVCLMSKVSSFLISLASWAPVTTAQSSSLSIDCCFLGVTRDLAMMKVTWTLAWVSSDRRYATEL